MFFFVGVLALVQALISWFRGAVDRFCAFRALWRYAQSLKEAITSGLAPKISAKHESDEFTDLVEQRVWYVAHAFLCVVLSGVVPKS